MLRAGRGGESVGKLKHKGRETKGYGESKEEKGEERDRKGEGRLRSEGASQREREA